MHQKLERELEILLKKSEKGPLTVRDIAETLSERGRAVLLILLSFPFCQPIQPPGFSTPFGIAIAFIGIRMVFTDHMWLPRKLMSKEVSAQTLQKLFGRMIKWSKKCKRWIHPRYEFIANSNIMHKVHGTMIFLLGVVLALPIPVPFSNLFAAWALLFIGVGILEDDGLFILLGYLVTLIAIIFFGVVGASLVHMVW